MITLVMVTYRIMAFCVVIAMMAAATAIMMVGWLAVILFGLLMPGWTIQRACTGFNDFIREAVAHVRALDPR